MTNPYRDSTSPVGGERRPSGRRRRSSSLRATVLFVLSAVIFVFSVIMCLHLIRKSGETEPIPTQAMTVKPLEYEVNTPPTLPVTQPENDPYQIELKKPESNHDSPVINILLLGVDKDLNDTQILCSVNLAERSLAMLSIPRDTYVAGEYDPPKAKNIYKSYDEQRRIGAVKDAIRGMVGFSVDYYYLIDQQTLTEALSLIGGLTFNVPESPDYHSLKSGNQTLDGKKAFELFRFKNSWTDVETDPARVQRTFLLALLDKLLGDEARISEICIKLSQVAKTDLSVEELAYMAYLLKDFDFDDAFSRALPGGEKEIDDEVYYEVDPEDAVELLNAHFNPLKKELTVFNVNFRQEQGASGEGHYSDYGHSSSTTESDGDEESSETDPDNTDETESTDPTEGTQDGGETGEPTESENSTETEATTQTEAPTETEDSGDSGNGTP